MDARSGDLLWKERISSGGGVGTPTIQDGGVFAATGLDRADPTAHGISALDALTGALRWRYRTPEDAVLFGPAADESGRAFAVGHDSRVVALDQATGAPIWLVQLDSTMDAAPVVACGDVYVATVDGELVVLSGVDGSLLRSIRIGSRPASVVVTGGMIVVTTHRGEVVVFADPPAAGS
jgi:outer membrane protein assembly factor BamB